MFPIYQSSFSKTQGQWLHFYQATISYGLKQRLRMGDDDDLRMLRCRGDKHVPHQRQHGLGSSAHGDSDSVYMTPLVSAIRTWLRGCLARSLLTYRNSSILMSVSSLNAVGSPGVAGMSPLPTPLMSSSDSASAERLVSFDDFLPSKQRCLYALIVSHPV